MTLQLLHSHTEFPCARFSGVVCPTATPREGAGELYKVLEETRVHGKALTVAFVGFGGGHGKSDGSFEEMMEIAKEATQVPQGWTRSNTPWVLPHFQHAVCTTS